MDAKACSPGRTVACQQSVSEQQVVGRPSGGQHRVLGDLLGVAGGVEVDVDVELSVLERHGDVDVYLDAPGDAERVAEDAVLAARRAADDLLL